MSVPPRTNTDAVANLLGENYDGTSDLNGFIEFASNTADRASALAITKGFGRVSLSATTLELMERALAAMNYCRMDPQLQAKTTAGASGQFVTSQTLEGEGDRYKRMAIEADYSGALNSILNRKKASGDHLCGGAPGYAGARSWNPWLGLPQGGQG